MTANIVGPCGAALISLVIELELPVKCSGMHQQETIAVVELWFVTQPNIISTSKVPCFHHIIKFLKVPELFI